MHLADLRSYSDAHQGLSRLYTDRQNWARRAILNVASSGRFSSDRTIAEYAAEIWQVASCPIDSMSGREGHTSSSVDSTGRKSAL
jgi:starch phosphorylase